MCNVGFYATTEGQHAISGPLETYVHADSTHIRIQLPLQLAPCLQPCRER